MSTRVEAKIAQRDLSISELFNGLIKVKGGGLQAEFFSQSILDSVLQDPASRLRQVDLYPVIEQLAGGNGRLEAGTAINLARFYRDRFTPVHRLVSTIPGRTLGSSYLSGRYIDEKDKGYMWDLYADGTLDILNNDKKYRLRIEKIQEEGINASYLVIEGYVHHAEYSKIITFNDLLVEIGEKEVNMPSLLQAKIWAAAAMDTPLELLLLAGDSIVRFTDPIPSEERGRDYLSDYFSFIDLIFNENQSNSLRIDSTSNDDLSRASYVNVLTRDYPLEFDHAEWRQVPLDKRKELLKDIVLALHFAGRKDDANRVVDYINSHFKTVIGREMIYDRLNDIGGVVVSKSYRHDIDLLDDLIEGAIVEFVPLEPAYYAYKRY